MWCMCVCVCVCVCVCSREGRKTHCRKQSKHLDLDQGYLSGGGGGERGGRGEEVK